MIQPKFPLTYNDGGATHPDASSICDVADRLCRDVLDYYRDANGNFFEVRVTAIEFQAVSCPGCDIEPGSDHEEHCPYKEGLNDETD